MGSGWSVGRVAPFSPGYYSFGSRFPLFCSAPLGGGGGGKENIRGANQKIPPGVSAQPNKLSQRFILPLEKIILFEGSRVEKIIRESCFLSRNFHNHLEYSLENDSENLGEALEIIYKQEDGLRKIAELFFLENDFFSFSLLLDLSLSFLSEGDREIACLQLMEALAQPSLRLLTRLKESMFQGYLDKNNLSSGEIIEAEVKSSHPKYGIFVRAKGVDGLLPRSKLRDIPGRKGFHSWEEVSPGKIIKVKVGNIGWEKKRRRVVFDCSPVGRIYFSSWQGFAREEMPLVGERVLARINNVHPEHGIFVWLPGGFTGLLDWQQVEQKGWNRGDLLKGDLVFVKVREIYFPREEKLDVSLKVFGLNDLYPSCEEVLDFLAERGEAPRRYDFQQILEEVKGYFGERWGYRYEILEALVKLAALYNQRDIWEKIIVHGQETDFFKKLNEDILLQLVKAVRRKSSFPSGLTDSGRAEEIVEQEANNLIEQAWPGS